MKITFSIVFTRTDAYNFKAIFPESSATFIKIYIDTAKTTKTPLMQFKHVGDTKSSVFSVTIDVQSFGEAEAIKILERNIFCSKYVYNINDAFITVEGKQIYKSPLQNR